MKIARTAVVILALVTTACGSNDSNKHMFAYTGAAIGALAGGWAGSQFGGGTGQLIYILGGAIAGGATGYDTVRSLDMADRPDYNKAVAVALSGQENALWENPDTGTGGYIRAGQAFTDGNGAYCRQYRATVAFDDSVLNGPGAACRTQSNDWVLVADAFQ